MTPTLSAEVATTNEHARLENATDEELLLRYRESAQRHYFEALIQRYQNEIYSYLRRYLGNAELAEDAFQLTFLQVHLRSETFDPTRVFRPWIYAIATNQAIDLIRKNRKHRSVSLDHTLPGDKQSRWSEKLVGSQPDPWLQAVRRESQESLQQLLSQLTDAMQGVIHLVYFQGMKYREAAEILGIPVGTVKSRLNAAISRLNQLWEESQASQ